MVLPGFPVSVSLLRERFGTETARAVSRAMVDTVDEIERVIAAEEIDAQWARGGALRLARGEHQRRASRAPTRRWTRSDSPIATSCSTPRRPPTASGSPIRSPRSTPVGASVHPARLARGLARAVERRGGTIYEQTPVVDYETGPAPRLITPYGDVRARTIVLAGEAYSQQLPKLRRTLVPMYSLIVLTEPLAESDWDQIGWRNRELVASSRMSVDYLNRTADGRILFGGRGAPYRMHSRSMIVWIGTDRPMTCCAG